MNTENLLPVGMLIVGWLLNELSRGLKTGGERRGVMAQTVCQFFLHLDDLRLSYHMLREMPKAVKALGSKELRDVAQFFHFISGQTLRAGTR
jgi:hypothetical protein